MNPIGFYGSKIMELIDEDKPDLDLCQCGGKWKLRKSKHLAIGFHRISEECEDCDVVRIREEEFDED